jgi:hypothetical protein
MMVSKPLHLTRNELQNLFGSVKLYFITEYVLALKNIFAFSLSKIFAMCRPCQKSENARECKCSLV